MIIMSIFRFLRDKKNKNKKSLAPRIETNFDAETEAESESDVPGSYPAVSPTRFAER
jgi:hypothetical protein